MTQFFFFLQSLITPIVFPWADPREAEEIDERMVKMKADMLSELIAVSIMRSEFEDANDVRAQNPTLPSRFLMST